MSISSTSTNPLFNKADFQLFTDYQGKSYSGYPAVFNQLKAAYDKLGKLAEYIESKGFSKSRMLKKPTDMQQKYCSYHWSKICFSELFNECDNKLFFVVGTNENGLYLEINYNEKDRTLICSKEADTIRKNSYTEIDQTWNYTLEQLADICIDYFNQNRKQFLLFAKEFNIIKAIKMLNQMNINEIKDLLLANHNIVLTGAPGTGKTYLAKKIAESMECDKDHIGFVQFHPSYDYTDFVEGLRPLKEGGTLGFQRKDGVFKDFCKKALQVQLNASFEKLYESIVKDIASGILTNYTTLSGLVYPLKVENGIIKYGYQKNGTVFKSENIDNVKLLYEHCVSHPKDIDYSTEGLRGLINRLTDGKISTLDPSEYSWTIQELLSRRNQLLSQKFVFIIDEINRGEISKIFGELFYAIDPGYRGEKGKVETQYQNLIPKEGDADFNATNPDVFRHGFFVPDNVYIIGTMNDIDRSVESMDFAMRRRFAWQEITAESRQSMLDEDDAWAPFTKPGQLVIEEIKNRMNNLNACIVDKYKPEILSPKDKIGLTTAYHIGASYFLKYALYNDFDKLWGNHLEGLLREYLRGTTNLEDKINRLMEAYNDTEHIEYK